VNPDAVVEDVAVGVQQLVEILKALYRDADCLVLDEPTAVLTPQEIEHLFGVIRTLKESGRSVIFISHKLKEVLAIADRITVLRRGAVVGTTTPQESDEQALATLMVGRKVKLEVDKTPAEASATVLRVENLEVFDERGYKAVDGASFEVRAGEILAIAGVQGNGQTELVEAITGLRTVAAGTVELAGRDATGASPKRLFRSGVAHVPEDRQADGLVGSFPVRDNLVLNTFDRPPYARGVIIDRSAVEKNAERLVRDFDIRAASVNAPVSTLSGGNQQKVIVAREFSHGSKLLIASQPTRGLDVGSIQYIHEQIIQRRDEGAAVLLVSSELDEIMSLSDRIAVMYGGRIVGLLDRKDATLENIGLLMAGVTEESA
jgi:simple sugar transport system ATP-binding protein